jgi:hypothetical protein
MIDSMALYVPDDGVYPILFLCGEVDLVDIVGQGSAEVGDMI